MHGQSWKSGPSGPRTRLGACGLLAPGACGLRAAEHFDQNRRGPLRPAGRNCSELSNQPLPVDCAQLVHGSLSGFSLKAHRYAGGIRAHGRRHGYNNDSLQMPVHLVGGNHQAWPGLPYFRAMGGIERHQPNFVPSGSAAHHLHSSRSKSLVTSSRDSSFGAGAAALNLSSHPARSRRFGEMMRHSFSTRKSTSSPSPHCSMSGLGMRIPRELPIRIKSVFIRSRCNYIVIPPVWDGKNSTRGSYQGTGFSRAEIKATRTRL
jgi:hypothetical protein